mgnify:CR=1 FL=1
MTTPTEFVLWLNGAAGVMGEAPTPEQWEVIKEKMNESLGFLAAKRLLERAEDQVVRDRENELKRAAAVEQMNRHAQYSADIARYQAVVDAKADIGAALLDVHAAKLSIGAAKSSVASASLSAPPEKTSFFGAMADRIKGAV